jgi:hypothetical protein
MRVTTMARMIHLLSGTNMYTCMRGALIPKGEVGILRPLRHKLIQYAVEDVLQLIEFQVSFHSLPLVLHLVILLLRVRMMQRTQGRQSESRTEASPSDRAWWALV